jgi:hypothetical protein
MRAQISYWFLPHWKEQRACRKIGWGRRLLPAAIVLGIVILCGTAAPVRAQVTSTIQGTVTDPTGLPLPGVEVKVNDRALSVVRTTTTDSAGTYRVPALPPGTYTLTVSHSGFATRAYENLEVVLNRVLTFDIAMEVGAVEEQVTVEASVPLLKPNTSDTGTTIVPQQIVDMPLNGRNYLDLMQLVPGVAINKQEDEGTDSSTPVLGERSGNTIFLIDGMPNRDEFGGGAAAQFNQDTIQEFEVLTTGFKAEFGHGSGGIVNVVTKSGTNDWHGSAFLFHRNSALDRNNSLDPTVTDAPFLLRWDYGVTLGGPIVKDKVFFFGSAERIRESRRLNFVFVPATPQVIQDSENSFNDPTRTFETRLFGKLEEQLGRHRLSQTVNVTNGHTTDFLPLSQATNLPSSRRSFDNRTTMLGFRDTALLGNTGNPFVLNLYLQYRDEPSSERPAHPDAGPQTVFNIFSAVDTFGVFGDLGSVTFGAGQSPSNFDQEYTSFGADLAKTLGRHTVKFGLQFLRTHVDGQEFQQLNNQTFCTEENFLRFGPVNCGFFLLLTAGGLTPEDNLVRLRNNYTGLFVQDDWKVLSNLTLNLGVRWNYDSEFNAKDNIGPRAGFAWSPLPKTVVRGSFGIFFDHFRLGVVRRVPAFGGAAVSVVQPFSYPQLFYNLTTIAPVLFGVCVDPTLTDAQIAASSATCPLGPFPYYGIDHINNTVITNAGGNPIPPETVVTVDNIQSLSGLTPDAFLAAVNADVLLPPGFSWFWDPVFGVLSHTGAPAQPSPSSLDPRFATPFTRSWNLGVQQEITPDVVVGVDYIHKDIENLLGVRQTNLLFESRFPGPARQYGPPNTLGEVLGFGPWYDGKIDAVIVSVTKRFSHRFTLTGSYTYTDATDNARIEDLGAGFGTGGAGIPSDSFVGVPPLVCDPTVTGDPTVCDSGDPSNADGSFWTLPDNRGNFVPQAGVFYNGPDLDKGRSGLALKHTFFIHGLVDLPLGFQVSSIFRTQSGFPFSQQTDTLDDVDGNLNFNSRDQHVARNSLTAPRFTNMDLRGSKRFQLGERVAVTALIEFFNLFNRQNPAAVEQVPGRPTPLGQPLQVLPGMETQVGLKVEF